MDNNRQGYISPFSTRYASKEMQHLFSDECKFSTWRKLWVALAKAQQKQGLFITDEQISQMEEYVCQINYDEAAKQERKTRHDVMSHVHAYGLQAEKAAGIIHLGVTSCYVGDNTDLLIMRKGLELIKEKLIAVISQLRNFAMEYRFVPTLAYTHLQPAQLTTVGKRASLWINDLYMDITEVEHRLQNLPFLGNKGTTGTQASFMALLEGDEDKVIELEKDIAQMMEFETIIPVSGQTYSRKIDYMVLSTLSGIAQSTSKFSNDMRLMQNFKEMEEPFEESQIGSSAMPYKRNPMRCERITALARYAMIDTLNPAITAATQWFERTLDDSANKRIAVAEAFLAIDSILMIMLNVTNGLVVYEKVITKRVKEELPFMATENIMMAAVKKGADRQKIHEKLRVYSHQAAMLVKKEGKENNLLKKIMDDEAFQLTQKDIENILDSSTFIGRAPTQVEQFIKNTIDPLLSQYSIKKTKVDLQV